MKSSFPCAHVSICMHLVVIFGCVLVAGVCLFAQSGQIFQVSAYLVAAFMTFQLVIFKYSYTPCLKQYRKPIFVAMIVISVGSSCMNMYVVTAQYPSLWYQIIPLYVTSEGYLVVSFIVIFLYDHKLTVVQTLLPSVLFGLCLLLVNMLVTLHVRSIDPDAIFVVLTIITLLKIQCFYSTTSSVRGLFFPKHVQSVVCVHSKCSRRLISANQSDRIRVVHQCRVFHLFFDYIVHFSASSSSQIEGINSKFWWNAWEVDQWTRSQHAYHCHWRT